MVLILLVYILQSCGGLGDWEYILPNDYLILRVNSQSIVFGRNEESFEQILDRYIWEFCYNESYIGLKRRPMDDIPIDKIVDIKHLDFSELEYYLIDAENDVLYGAYDYGEYIVKCEALCVGQMCEWINTNNIGGGSYEETCG